jgi:hypothetical protein
MTAGQWRPAGTSDAVASGSLILSGGATRAYLGPDHPLTRAVRDNLEATTRT